MEYLIYAWQAFYTTTLVIGFAITMLWAFAKFMQTDEDWDRDE